MIMRIACYGADPSARMILSISLRFSVFPELHTVTVTAVSVVCWKFLVLRLAVFLIHETGTGNALGSARLRRVADGVAPAACRS